MTKWISVIVNIYANANLRHRIHTLGALHIYKVLQTAAKAYSLFRVTEENLLFETGLYGPTSFLLMFQLLLKELICTVLYGLPIPVCN